MTGDDRLGRVPDSLLESAYAAVRDDVPRDVDWDRLRRSIGGRAAPALARRRAGRRAPNGRPLIMLAAAASVALALGFGPALLERLSTPDVVAEAAASLDAEQILVEALGSDLTEDEFRLVVSGRAYPEALLAFAIREP